MWTIQKDPQLTLQAKPQTTGVNLYLGSQYALSVPCLEQNRLFAIRKLASLQWSELFELEIS